MSTLGEALRDAIEKKGLAHTISQWDDEDNNMKQHVKDIPVINLNTTSKQASGSHAFPITTNASRVTFEFIKANNNRYTPKQIAIELEKQGQKVSTVLSLCYQLMKNNLIERNGNDTLRVLVDTYTPVKSAAALRNKALKESGFSDAPKKKVVMIKRRTDEGLAGIAALQEQADAHIKKQKWIADEVIDSLSVLQARELYLKLKEIFGG